MFRKSRAYCLSNRRTSDSRLNSHEKRLLRKLTSYRVDEKLIAWIEAFLCNRMQQVKINGVLSGSKSVLSGIPQGTVLGPLKNCCLLFSSMICQKFVVT